MASRDKSQNVGFVYTNIYQLFKKSQNAAPNAATPSEQPASSSSAAAPAANNNNNNMIRPSTASRDSNVWRADSLTLDQFEGIKITKFQPRDLNAKAPADAAAKSAISTERLVVGNPFDDLKANLQKLQDLHSKLRFMLKELETLVEKK